MKSEYGNRHNMFLTILNLLNNPEYEDAWKGKKPAAFTTRAGEFRIQLPAVTKLISEQQAATTGYAETKEGEQEELEDTAYEIGQTLADWYEENGREGDSAQIDLSLSGWQRLSDTALIAKAGLLHNKLVAALAEAPAELAEYDLTEADATRLADFKKITADPSAAIPAAPSSPPPGPPPAPSATSAKPPPPNPNPSSPPPDGNPTPARPTPRRESFLGGGAEKEWASRSPMATIRTAPPQFPADF